MTDTSQYDPAPAWEVVSQQPASGPTMTGTFGPGHLITVRLTGTTTVFQVFVPNENLTPEVARAMIAQKAVTVAAINALRAG